MPDDQPSLDPLFIGLTRPPMVMGVPMTFFGLNFILFGIGMIAFNSILGMLTFFVFPCLVFHMIGYFLTVKDPHWMQVYLTRFSKCGPTRNRRFWSSDSYAP